MLTSKRIKNFKPFIFILLFIPSLIWIYQFINGDLGVNPIEKLMDLFGEMALRLIITTLFISSLADFKNLKSLSTLRRMVGLFAFFYVLLHFSTYIFLDHYLDLNFIIKDIVKRPFILFGFISFVFLIPLALTSRDNIIKKLGFKVWKRLHYLIYPAAILSSIHFYMLVRANKIEPLIYIIIIALLLLYRFYKKIILPLLAPQ